MASKSQVLEAKVRPPFKGEVLAFDITTSTQVLAIPDSWEWVEVETDGGKAWIQAAGSSAIAITTSAKNTLSGTTPSASTEVGKPLADGRSIQFERTSETTHIGWRGTASAGLIYIRRAANPCLDDTEVTLVRR